MGSGASKAARPAANAARRYPTRPSEATKAPPPTPAARTGRLPQTQITSNDPSLAPKYDAATEPRASETRDHAINLDARDPHFASRLREIGPVQPSPTYSPSSTTSPSSTSAAAYPKTPTSSPPSQQGAMFPDAASNPALRTLSARQRLEQEFETDRLTYGKKGFGGRRYVEISLLRRILVMRDEQGVADADIERQLGLKQGFVQRLGVKGTIEAA